jgi:hypothetical protein
MLPFFLLLDFIQFITKNHLIKFYKVLLLSKSLYYCFNYFVNLCYVFHLSGSFCNFEYFLLTSKTFWTYSYFLKDLVVLRTLS